MIYYSSLSLCIYIKVSTAKFRTWPWKVEFLRRGCLDVSAGVPRIWKRKGRGIGFKLQQGIHSRCLPAVSVGCDDVGCDVCLRCQVAATLLDAGVLNRFLSAYSRDDCLQCQVATAMSDSIGRHSIFESAFSRDVCLYCQAAATMSDAICISHL